MRLGMMKNIFIERRERKGAIPRNFMRYFNEDQVNTYIKLKEAGWKLYFIRRPRLRKHTIALIDVTSKHVGVIEQSGNISIDQGMIKLRV